MTKTAVLGVLIVIVSIFGQANGAEAQRGSVVTYPAPAGDGRAAEP